MQIVDVKKLADLARIDMSEEEMKEIGDSFGPILDYVGQIQQVSDSLDITNKEVGQVPFNILREDVVTNKTGEYTQKILSQAPDTENGFLKVKQIL